MAKKTASGLKKLPKKAYEKELAKLQAELVVMQEWVKHTGNRVVIVCEGRDAAGKGSAIKRITEVLNPRQVRISALPAPSDREKTQWYFQKYIAHLPSAGEIAIFDRSWYNRAGVERVMGFCTDAEYERFLRQAPIFEQMLIEDGIMLRKYWFSVSDKEQEARFLSRAADPMRRWKLSPMDPESLLRWEEYSLAKDEMMAHTDVEMSPWWVVESGWRRLASTRWDSGPACAQPRALGLAFDGAIATLLSASPASTPRMCANEICIPGSGSLALISYSRFT